MNLFILFEYAPLMIDAVLVAILDGGRAIHRKYEL
jgi:hypothetical protein